MLQNQHFPIVFIALCMMTSACSSDEPQTCTASKLNASTPNALFGESCSSLGDWSVEVDLVSSGENFVLSCSAAANGTLECRESSLDLSIELTFTDELLIDWTITNGATTVPVDEVAIVLSGPTQERSAWLSNGFQSWSMSGALELRGDLGYNARRRVLEDLGDQELSLIHI